MFRRQQFCSGFHAFPVEHMQSDVPLRVVGSSAAKTHVYNMKNKKKYNGTNKNAKFKPGSKKRENKCIVTFDDKNRQ